MGFGRISYFCKSICPTRHEIKKNALIGRFSFIIEDWIYLL